MSQPIFMSRDDPQADPLHDARHLLYGGSADADEQDLFEVYTALTDADLRLLRRAPPDSRVRRVRADADDFATPRGRGGRRQSSRRHGRRGMGREQETSASRGSR